MQRMKREAGGCWAAKRRSEFRAAGAGQQAGGQSATNDGKEEQDASIEGEAEGFHAGVALGGEHPGLELGAGSLGLSGVGGARPAVNCSAICWPKDTRVCHSESIWLD